LGILLGICAGIIDVLPMLAQNLSWDADISAFPLLRYRIAGALMHEPVQPLKDSSMIRMISKGMTLFVFGSMVKDGGMKRKR
jgi:hypothetical protein